MTFSIEKSKLPRFSGQRWEVITLELGRFDGESEWVIDWLGEIIVSDTKHDCWIINGYGFTIAQEMSLNDYIAANQAEIEKQAQENREADRADYEYAKYMEDRGM